MASHQAMPVNGHFKDLTGQSFNDLTVVSYAGKNSRGKVWWLCQCSCGGNTKVTTAHLKNNNTRTCGDRKRHWVNTPEEFWGRVSQPVEGCWEWTGPRNKPGGYGHLTVGGRQWAAHRLAYTLAVGPIPDDLWVLHGCDNPACCRPGHLSLGTVVDNVADMIARGRGGMSCPHPWCAKLTPALVREIRARQPTQSKRSLCREYDISMPTLLKLLRGQTWRHVG